MQANEDTNLMMGSPTFEAVDKRSDRKMSEDTELMSMSKAPSFMKTSSVITFMRVRKETSALLETEYDRFIKRLKRTRYLKFQGAYLYYPIACIDEPVSLLACFLNSDEFKESTKSTKSAEYRDEIIVKMQFTKEMRNDWKPFVQMKKIYKELTKDDPNGY
jgi:hypothetical protein